MLIIKDLRLQYDKNIVLDNINLELKKHTIYTFIGPSGCGKSSLINILAGNIKTYTGNVYLEDAPINPQKKHIGLIPQNHGLLPWRTVYKNITLPLKIKRLKIVNYADKIDFMINGLGLSNLINRYPRNLSGGEKQRAAICAALVLNLDLLLMDEPFSALDAITKEKTQELFLKLWQEDKPLTILVTHSIDEAVFLGNNIIIMSSNGKIIDIINNPSFGQENSRTSQESIDTSNNIRSIVNKYW